MSSTMHASSSAERWGPLWGARPADWAINEEQHVPGYEAADFLPQNVPDDTSPAPAAGAGGMAHVAVAQKES